MLEVTVFRSFGVKKPSDIALSQTQQQFCGRFGFFKGRKSSRLVVNEWVMATTRLYNSPHITAVHYITEQVFGDIMVLASRPPEDPDDVNTNSKNIQHISFKFYMRVDL